MKITAIYTLRADAGWRMFSFLKITTDSGAIGCVSCAAQAIRLPGGETAAVGLVVPACRLPRELLGPLRVTAERIATLVALHGPQGTREN